MNKGNFMYGIALGFSLGLLVGLLVGLSVPTMYLDKNEKGNTDVFWLPYPASSTVQFVVVDEPTPTKGE